MKQYVVDAFTDKLFSGNPAAVCALESWPEDELLLKIARENNLSETAFFAPEGERYRLRWFTPGGEIDLCGHATLAMAFVIMSFIEPQAERIEFDTLSGVLSVEKKDDVYEMDFPAYTLKEIPVTDAMSEAIGARPVKAYMGRDLLCVMDSEETVRALRPDLRKVSALDGLLLQVTANSKKYDCVSRTFAPKLDVPENPFCGSGHCHILPYWSEEKNKTELVAYQASARGGMIYGRVRGDRVVLGGKAMLFAKAELYI